MKETPIRRQYLQVKQQYPGAIVLFRLGDFYETFDDDARIASRELEIVLTSREMGKGEKIPMAGIPFHAVDNYLAKLINRGYKVAICEQTTRPGETKGIVQRDVIRVVTPGTVVEPGLLDSKTNNYLVAVVISEPDAGVAYVDITTGEFGTTQLPIKRLLPELERLKPSEIIVPQDTEVPALSSSVPVTRIDGHHFLREVAQRKLLDHFGVATLDSYGCTGLPLAVRAAGSVIYYLEETQKGVLNQLTRLSTYSTEAYMALDIQTQRNLELFRNNRNDPGSSLLSVIDMTKTAMGGRILKKWLSQPLLDVGEIIKRQGDIGWFVDRTLPRTKVIGLLSGIADLERLINRVRSNIVIPRELISLRHSLEVVPGLKEVITDENLRSGLKPFPDVVSLIDGAVADDPSSSPGDGDVIKTGFSDELDKLRSVSKNARQYLADMERQEREKTGIKSLKVGYNKVFGYYIEVSHSNISQVPPAYIRKQTLVNGERFITPELKDYESMILNAQERISELETDLFRQVCSQIALHAEAISEMALRIAYLDIVSSLAEVAVRYSYVKPEVNDGSEIIINSGRHPVVERMLPDGKFVANNTELSNENNQLIILTGPNMSGKSTYLRQVALIVLLAQTGSYIPALSARIGVVDRIFTRIGAGEDIAAGQSTFMVEMVETANILNNATPRSLIILDEIGRGTSTYDGLSIARAVVEYIHNHPRLGTKTLFATHYHELVDLARFLPRVKNNNVAVAEEGGEVVFLYRIEPGGVDKSYGIHVARLAGLPGSVVHRAHEVLAELESGSGQHLKKQKRQQEAAPQLQLTLLGQRPPVLEELDALDINSLSPLEALTKLYELQKKAREQG